MCAVAVFRGIAMYEAGGVLSGACPFQCYRGRNSSKGLSLLENAKCCSLCFLPPGNLRFAMWSMSELSAAR
jgi:hypothetical protein